MSASKGPFHGASPSVRVKAQEVTPSNSVGRVKVPEKIQPINDSNYPNDGGMAERAYTRAFVQFLCQSITIRSYTRDTKRGRTSNQSRFYTGGGVIPPILEGIVSLSVKNHLYESGGVVQLHRKLPQTMNNYFQRYQHKHVGDKSRGRAKEKYVRFVIDIYRSRRIAHLHWTSVQLVSSSSTCVCARAYA